MKKQHKSVPAVHDSKETVIFAIRQIAKDFDSIHHWINESDVLVSSLSRFSQQDHVDVINHFSIGFERICLALVYLELPRNSKCLESNLELIAIFILSTLQQDKVTREDFLVPPDYVGDLRPAREAEIRKL